MDPRALRAEPLNVSEVAELKDGVHENNCFWFVRGGADCGDRGLRAPAASCASATSAATGHGAAAASAACHGAHGVTVADALGPPLWQRLALGSAPPHRGGQIGARSLRAEPLIRRDAPHRL